MIAATGFYFAQPAWLALALLAPAAFWWGLRCLRTLSTARRWTALILRCLVIILLALLLARPSLTETNEQLTLLAVVDRSQSIPESLRQSSLEYLDQALVNRDGADQLAVIDIAETALIASLPTSVPTDVRIPERNVTLTGQESNLGKGIQMAMAIAPPNTASRILLVTDGNETAGDIKEAARVAAANNIPIDVLPLAYRYDSEVVFRRLAAPAKARSGQTVNLRFVLNSTRQTTGQLQLNLNGVPVDLDPGSDQITAAVELKPGTNVKTVSVPVGQRGMHEFQANFIPDNASLDVLQQNNQASAMTYVAGPGRVLVLHDNDPTGQRLAQALADTDLHIDRQHVSEFPQDLAELMDIDAVVLVNTENVNFTYQQQEMLVRYVSDLGGGLVMIGGPAAFGAGGWIGSPAQEVIPVELDPPQKKQMPKGALVMVMHACEMPKGNYWGKQVAMAAAKSLSRLDLAGVLDYGWNAGEAHWVYPLGPVGNKKEITAAIKQMQMGDMPDFGPPLQAAYDALSSAKAGQKHIIIISDGDPAPPSTALIKKLQAAKITCTTVAVFPHSNNPAALRPFELIAQLTGGRFYHVKDPQKLPQIFIKEAQIVRRALILEETFTPKVRFSLNEILKGLDTGFPQLDGYVLTGPRGGLSQLVLTSPAGDPILATMQAGLGRSIAFTSSADSRWAANWLAWPGFGRFWEQTLRWVSKSGQSRDCEVFADVTGRSVQVTVEAVDEEGRFLQLADVAGQAIAPNMSAVPLDLAQVGPGRYRAEFQAGGPGSYILNLKYAKPDEPEKTLLVQSAVTVPYAPEFRDLAYNEPLLNEIASMTKGRYLQTAAEDAQLFSREGVTFPKTATPLTNPLLLIWVGLFLLDVAVRRIALDFYAIRRRLAALVRRSAPAKAPDATLERLRLSREQLHQRWTKPPSPDTDAAATTHAQRRYQAADTYTGDIPLSPTQTGPTPRTPPPADKAAQPAKTKPAPAEGPEHLQRLLRVKRQARKDQDQQ